MKVTVNGFDIEGTEDEIIRLLGLISQNGSCTTTTETVQQPRRQRRRNLSVGPREYEVMLALRGLLGVGDDEKENGITSSDLAPVLNWKDVDGDSETARSRTSATLSNLQKKRLVIRPIGQSRWYLTRTGRVGKLAVRGGVTL